MAKLQKRKGRYLEEFEHSCEVEVSMGFMLETLKPPPTLPPGQTLKSRAEKFEGWSGANSGYGHDARRLDTFVSDAKNSQQSTANFDLFGQSYNISKKLKSEQRGSTAAQPASYYSSNMMLKSVMRSGYANAGALGKEAKATDDLLDAFRDAFNLYADETDMTQIGSQDVGRMVLVALGDHQVPYACIQTCIPRSFR